MIASRSYPGDGFPRIRSATVRPVEAVDLFHHVDLPRVLTEERVDLSGQEVEVDRFVVNHPWNRFVLDRISRIAVVHSIQFLWRTRGAGPESPPR